MSFRWRPYSAYNANGFPSVLGRVPPWILRPPTPFLLLLLQDPHIRVTGIERINNILEGPYVESYSIKVAADYPAIFVWLEAPGISGRFNNNGFHQITSEHEVIFQAKEPTSVAQLEDILSVRTYTVAPCTSPCL